MAPHFTLLPSVGDSIDKLVGDVGDIAEIQKVVTPVISRSDVKKLPNAEDFVKLTFSLCRAISTTSWGTQHGKEKGDLMINYLLQGIARENKWPGIGTAANPLKKPPYQYFLSRGYTTYLSAVEAIGNGGPNPIRKPAASSSSSSSSSSAASPSSSSSTPPTTAQRRRRSAKKEEGSPIPTPRANGNKSEDSNLSASSGPTKTLDDSIQLSSVDDIPNSELDKLLE